MKDTKKCPFCGEEIKAEAIKCRYCGEWLDKVKKNVEPEQKDNSESPRITNSEKKGFFNFYNISVEQKRHFIFCTIALLIIVIGCFGFNSYHSKMIMQKNTIVIDSALSQLDSKYHLIAKFPDKKRHCAYYYIPNDSIIYRFDAQNNTTEIFNLGLHKGEGDDYTLNDVDTAFVNPQNTKIILITTNRGNDFHTNFLLIDTYSMTVNNIAISKSYDDNIKIKENAISVYTDKYVQYTVSCDGATDSTSVIDTYDFNGKKLSSTTANIADGKHNKEDFANYEVLLDASKDNRHCIYYVNKETCIKYDINTKIASTIISCKQTFHPCFLKEENNSEIMGQYISERSVSSNKIFITFILNRESCEIDSGDFIRYDTNSNSYMYLGIGWGMNENEKYLDRDIVYIPEAKVLNPYTAAYAAEYRYAFRKKVINLNSGIIEYFTPWSSN